MVVEDNPGDFALIEDYLLEKIAAPHIRRAKTYKEAWVLLTSQEIDFDTILLDLSLPDKSGTDLITNIIQLSPDCPVIVLTGYSDISFGIKSLSLGISDYLLKDELSSSPLYKSIIYSIERKKTLRRLEESEKKYSDLFQLSPQPMWVYDLETLSFLRVNYAAVKHYGYTEEEFLSMSVKDIRPIQDIPLIEEAIAMIKKHDQYYSIGIFRHTKKNGEIIYVEIQGNIIQFDGKKAELILASDITERFEHVKAIEKQNERLKEIAWTQSHVVRAPLARMMGIVNLISELQCASPECESLLGYLQHSCSELDTIIREIAKKASLIETK